MEDQTTLDRQPQVATSALVRRCPFCGCKPKVRRRFNEWGKSLYYVCCRAERCGVQPETNTHTVKGYRMTRAEAIAMWNASPNTVLSHEGSAKD